MKTFLLLILVSISFSQNTQAADTTRYIKEMRVSLNLTNTSISDNWYKGGNSTLTWNVHLKYNFTTSAKTYSWTHKGKVAYGKSELEGVINPSRVMENEIKHETVYTKKFGYAVEPFISASALTQISTSHDYNVSPKTPISNFFDPAYFTQAVGIGFTSEDLAFNTRAGFSVKETIADKYAIALTDDPDTEEIEDVKVDMGLKLNASYNMKFENYTLSTGVEFFSELDAINKTDAVFDLTLSSEVNKFLKFSFDFDLRYDADISQTRQMMHVLSIGAYYDIY
jgi:hypothetical protein